MMFVVMYDNSGHLTIWDGDQQTPNHNQNNPEDYVNNPTTKYHLGYIDHGTNPQNSDYEYVVFNEKDVQQIVSFKKGSEKNSKPYTVHQKDSIAHLLEYKKDNTWITHFLILQFRFKVIVW